MDKQRGSITIIIVALLLLVVVIAAGFLFLAPMLLNKPVAAPVVVNQNIQPIQTKVATPTPVSSDSGQLVPPINNQADLDKASTNLDDTTFTGIDSDMSQLSSDASSF